LTLAVLSELVDLLQPRIHRQRRLVSALLLLHPIDIIYIFGVLDGVGVLVLGASELHGLEIDHSLL